MPENIGNEYASATPENEVPVQPKKSFCKYCGNEVQNGAAFCPSCGKPQGNIPVQQMTSPIAQQPQQFYGQPVQQPNYMTGAYQQPQPAMAMNTANSNTQSSQTTVYVQGSRSNGMGTAGFIFALLALFFFWAPIANFIIWFLGLLFSFIGLFKSPRGLAITGFILSILGIIMIVAVGGMLLAAINS